MVQSVSRHISNLRSRDTTYVHMYVYDNVPTKLGGQELIMHGAQQYFISVTPLQALELSYSQFIDIKTLQSVHVLIIHES